MPDYTYTVIFEPNEAGGYTVSVPALPGLVTEGLTVRKVVRQAGLIEEEFGTLL